MTPEISVVIPLYNEALNVGELYAELTATLEGANRTYELILVDDGSSDETYAILAGLHAKDPRVRVVRLRRNFGQTAAFAAGFSRARGRVIVTSDGDLQNDPRDIPTMLAELDQGYDIVCGWRKDRKDPWLTRRVPSMMANWLISVTTGVGLHDYGCSLKVFRAEVIKPLRLYGEMHRFIPAIASEQGVRIAELVVNHRPRRFGRSKYGLSRTVRVVFDLVTVKFLLSYSTRPLQIFGPIGLSLGVIGAIIMLYLGYVRLFGGQAIGDRPLLLLATLMVFAGLQLVTLGLLAELQARTYHESQGKPIYVIREVLESSDARDEAHVPIVKE
jgi:glycosyltransferase involved in cell wall biosynthesis